MPKSLDKPLNISVTKVLLPKVGPGNIIIEVGDWPNYLYGEDFGVYQVPLTVQLNDGPPISTFWTSGTEKTRSHVVGFRVSTAAQDISPQRVDQIQVTDLYVLS